MLIIDVDLTIKNPISKIDYMVHTAIKDELNKLLPNLIPNIKKDIVDRTRPFFHSSKGYLALINGPLNKEFGIPKGEEKKTVDIIIEIILHNLNITFKKFSYRGGAFDGGITVGVILADYIDILSNPAAGISTAKGEIIPWVKWLTLQGSQTIIEGYRIKFGDFSDPKYNSRSMGALMLKIPTTWWRVPTEYAGTARDNWLTRAFTEVGDAWGDMIGEVLKSHIEN